MGNENWIIEVKAILLILAICSLFYIFLFTLVHLTSSPEKRPPYLFWDDRRQGYTKDILEDRYWEIREQKEKENIYQGQNE
ncbi:MAG: hypothetical protein KatS3mg084_0514 [Candidatus Dojkabacteria bacterium]|nr:MAG: hypothetical protein KatS3mg084_0514 [Candidatus Dojkabacteria bacterium]